MSESEHKTDKKLLEAQKKYYAKEEVKERKRLQYLKKKREKYAIKMNKIIEQYYQEIETFTEEEKEHFYQNFCFKITRKL
jgi:hypothetical protein